MDRGFIRAKRLGFNISKNHDLSFDLLNIEEKPDVAVWNKVISIMLLELNPLKLALRTRIQ